MHLCVAELRIGGLIRAVLEPVADQQDVGLIVLGPSGFLALHPFPVLRDVNARDDVVFVRVAIRVARGDRPCEVIEAALTAVGVENAFP